MWLQSKPFSHMQSVPKCSGTFPRMGPIFREISEATFLSQDLETCQEKRYHCRDKHIKGYAHLAKDASTHSPSLCVQESISSNQLIVFISQVCRSP